jgi:23S rRNA pseudouridine1911/1915/1917 synthase
LNQQILERQICRIYLAFVSGVMRYSQKIDVPIGRDPHNRLKKKAAPFDDKARHACTHVTVLERFQNASFVECLLETGRTHQIRVHLEHIGHPLLGEQLYSKKQGAQKMLSRQALHAHKLSLTEPLTDKRVHFESPLPEDLLALYRQLQS